MTGGPKGRRRERERRKGEGETDRRTRFSDRAVCTRTREEDGGDVTGGPFPSIAWLHPHAATAAVEAHNLATVARYNRYCGRGLNGGELAQVKPPHRHDNPSAGGATPRHCSLSVVSHPTQPLRVLLGPYPSASFLPSLPPLGPTASPPLAPPPRRVHARRSYSAVPPPRHPFDCLRLYGVAHACAAVFARLCVGCECRAAARWRSCAPAPVYVRACN